MLGLLPRVAFLGFLLVTTVTTAALAEMVPWAASGLTGADADPFDVAPLDVEDAYGHRDGDRFTSVTLTLSRGLTGTDVDVTGLAATPVRDADGSLAHHVLNGNDLARVTIPVDWDGAEPLTLVLEAAAGTLKVTVEADGGAAEVEALRARVVRA